MDSIIKTAEKMSFDFVITPMEDRYLVTWMEGKDYGATAVWADEDDNYEDCIIACFHFVLGCKKMCLSAFLSVAGDKKVKPDHFELEVYAGSFYSCIHSGVVDAVYLQSKDELPPCYICQEEAYGTYGKENLPMCKDHKEARGICEECDMEPGVCECDEDSEEMGPILMIETTN